MSKEKSDKKERKEKREKVSEDGVKKEKRERKEKRKSLEAATATLGATEDVSTHAELSKDGDGDVDMSAAESTAVVKFEIPKSALVPFANPLADDKNAKRVLKTVKKAAKQKCLKRGVKEVVKAVRKSPAGNPTNATALPPGIVVLAADISPMDVISHLPVLCEDHNIPYVFLTSRAELGAAGATKRPTSVVMVTPKAGGVKKTDKVEGEEEWTEAFGDFNKLVLKLGQHVKI